MDIDIGEIVSSVRAVDDKALLSPQVLRKIVESVLQAVEDRERHGEREGAERRVDGGVDPYPTGGG
jgi:hypothetical protein